MTRTGVVLCCACGQNFVTPPRQTCRPCIDVGRYSADLQTWLAHDNPECVGRISGFQHTSDGLWDFVADPDVPGPSEASGALTGLRFRDLIELEALLQWAIKQQEPRVV